MPDFVDTEGIDKVYVLFEIDYVVKGGRWRDNIVRRAMELNGDDPSKLDSFDYFDNDSNGASNVKEALN